MSDRPKRRSPSTSTIHGTVALPPAGYSTHPPASTPEDTDESDEGRPASGSPEWSGGRAVPFWFAEP